MLNQTTQLTTVNLQSGLSDYLLQALGGYQMLVANDYADAVFLHEIEAAIHQSPVAPQLNQEQLLHCVSASSRAGRVCLENRAAGAENYQVLVKALADAL